MIFTLLDLLHPKLPVLLGWKAVRPEVENFFREAIREAASLKESEAAARKDFLQILIDFQKSEMASKTELDDNSGEKKISELWLEVHFNTKMGFGVLKNVY